MPTPISRNRQEIIDALTNAGLDDFHTPEEMNAAHALLKDMKKNDFPKKRERKSKTKPSTMMLEDFPDKNA